MISSPPGFGCICHVWSVPSNSLCIQVLCLFVSKANLKSSYSSLPLSTILTQTFLHLNFSAILTVLICVIQSVLQCLFAESRWTSESFLHLILSIFHRNNWYCRHSLPERLVFLDKHKLSWTDTTSFTTKNNYRMI